MADYFTVVELAKEFRGNPKTIYRRLWAKGIPAYKVGRAWRVAKKDIKWLRQIGFYQVLICKERGKL